MCVLICTCVCVYVFVFVCVCVCLCHKIYAKPINDLVWADYYFCYIFKSQATEIQKKAVTLVVRARCWGGDSDLHACARWLTRVHHEHWAPMLTYVY